MSVDTGLQRLEHRREALQRLLRSAIMAETIGEMQNLAGAAHAEAVNLDDELNALLKDAAWDPGLPTTGGDKRRARELVRAARDSVEYAILAAQRIGLADTAGEMRAYILDFMTQADFAEAYLRAALGTEPKKVEVEIKPGPDDLIRQAMLLELHDSPELQGANIAVEVEDGIVTLRGTVDSLSSKWAAEQAALRVPSVRGVVNDIEVRLPPDVVRDDKDLVRAAIEALHEAGIPEGRVKVFVREGWITLTGAIDREEPRKAVEAALYHVPGVAGVTNHIEVRPIAAATSSDT